MTKKILIAIVVLALIGFAAYTWQSGKAAAYGYKIIETKAGDCQAPNLWKGCTIQILKNGKVVESSQELDIPKVIGGLPIKWMDDDALLTFAESSSPGYDEKYYYLYSPKKNSKEFYYSIHSTTEFSGTRVVHETYFKNYGSGELDFAAWLVPNRDSGEMMVRIANQPHRDERWCRITDRTEYENCLLSSTPYQEFSLGTLSGAGAAASGYTITIERDGSTGLLKISAPSGSSSFTLDVLTGSISKI